MKPLGNKNLIPVVLRFKNIVGNSNISFTFTTRGVKWCLGSNAGDSLGFSYNVLSSNNGGVEQSCIQSIEFNDSLLDIRTGGNEGSLYDFILTFFVEVAENTDFVQGYCTLNNEGRVYANFGDDKAIQWRNGRISAVLRPSEEKYRIVFLNVTGAKPGNRIKVLVDTKKGLGKVNWCLGPDFSDSSGIQLYPSSGSLPISEISYGNNCIEFQTSAESAHASDSLAFTLIAYITWFPQDLEFLYLQLTGNEDITLTAQIGATQPQLVSRTSTLFTL